MKFDSPAEFYEELYKQVYTEEERDLLNRYELEDYAKMKLRRGFKIKIAKLQEMIEGLNPDWLKVYIAFGGYSGCIQGMQKRGLPVEDAMKFCNNIRKAAVNYIAQHVSRLYMMVKEDVEKGKGWPAIREKIAKASKYPEEDVQMAEKLYTLILNYSFSKSLKKGSKRELEKEIKKYFEEALDLYALKQVKTDSKEYLKMLLRTLADSLIERF